MQFDLIRLVLVSRAQTSLFEHKDEKGGPLTREAWLRRKFAETIAFKHAKKDFHYIPDPNAWEAGLIAGQIGRQIKAVENLSPDEGFKEIERSPWKAALIFIDPKHHKDGQKLSFEVDQHVGNPISIFQSLAKHINAGTDEPYILEANSIVDPKNFWDFEREYRGKITSITFDLVAPNMFGIRDQMDAEM